MEFNRLKSGFVAIIGLPNAGKSTFLNVVLKEKLAITSNKPQTTRKNLKGIYTDNEAQIIFVDTPGIHNVKNKLDEFMQKSIKFATSDIDLIIVIVDIMNFENKDFTKINDMLKNNNIKKILMINKVDVYNKINENVNDVKENILLKFDNSIKFEEVLFISSLKNKHIDNAINIIKKYLPIGEMYYPEDNITDESTKQIIADMIRQQCLYKLENEIPHGVAVIIDSIKISKSKCMNIDANIICEKMSHKGIIIGKKGQMIKNIGTGARIAIEKFFDKKVNLKLNVLVKTNWRDEKTLIANFGYEIDE